MAIAVFEEMERASLTDSIALCNMIDKHIGAFDERLAYYEDILEKYTKGDITEDDLQTATAFSTRHT
jgi:hypothetical protein